MPEKIRVSFYPSDSSRIREFTFSRRLGLLLLFSLVPLSLSGFWLTCSGALRPDEDERAAGERLLRENSSLRERTEALESDFKAMEERLGELEEQKINLALLSGVEYLEAEETEKRASLFSFLADLTPSEVDDSAALSRARAVSAYFDSALQLLEAGGDKVKAIPTGYPIDPGTMIIREFGYIPDPFTARKGLHAGVDFSSRPGEPVYASGAGNVALAKADHLWGNCIRIEHAPGVHTFYAHLEELRVKSGQQVARGEIIGTIGATGVASGPHLHFELILDGEKVDPLRYFLPPLQVHLLSEEEDPV